MEYVDLPDDRSIRLLEILPRTDEYDVVCRLEVSSLDTCSAYRALSYVWGPPTFDHSIMCNGHAFNVTRSLHQILVFLQRANTGNLFWIDQICINQNGISERAQQVRLMGDIYRRAATVICSLGQADDDTRTVWHLFSNLQQKKPLHLYESMATDFIETLENRPSDPSSSSVPPQHTTRLALPGAASNDWKAVQRFLVRPWFTRCWTYQEALLGSICMLQCGMFEMPFDSFHEATRLLYDAGYGELMGRGHWTVSAIGLQRVYLKNSLTGPRLAYMLPNTRDRKATNPHDKVYALLGVIDCSTADLINADYSRSVDEIYADAARACIRGSVSLEILTHVEVRRYDDHTFPSWVPDWRYLESTQLALGIKTRNGSQYFQATGRLEPLLFPTQDWRKLGLKGFLLAPIMSFLDVRTALQLRDSCIRNNSLTSKRWDTRTWIQMYHSAIDALHIPVSCVKQPEVIDEFTKNGLGLSSEDPPPLYNQLQTAFRRTMTADLHPLSPGRAPDEHYYTAFHSWKRRGFPDVIPPQVLLEHDQYVLNFMFQREFFIAGSEPDCYMGVALGTVREGDWVCIFAGGDTPYVLRPRGKTPDQDVADVEEWEFVHDCYIHGVMHGEALQKLEKSSFKWKDFILV